MMISPAIALGIEFRILAERADDAAAAVARDVDIGSPVDGKALRSFAECCDFLTFDHELVNADALRDVAASGHAVRPSPDVVALVQDKLRQRQTLDALGCPIPPFQAVASIDDLQGFAERHGWPVVVKALRGGYDGRGVWVVRDASEASRVWDGAKSARIDVMVEAWVPIEREIASLVARRPNGEIAHYPVVETVQSDGICRELVAPAQVSGLVQEKATSIAARIAEAISLEGVMAVEMFQVGETVLVNELAARVHNSGHYTIEGCATSQFEQHLRAILDWPLGDTTLRAPVVVTVNVLGGADGSDPSKRLKDVLGISDCHVHLYGKEARPGRKLGHVTALGEDRDETLARARRAAAVLTGEAG